MKQSSCHRGDEWGWPSLEIGADGKGRFSGFFLSIGLHWLFDCFGNKETYLTDVRKVYRTGNGIESFAATCC